MRRRTISIAEPQQRHCNLGRSLRVGGVTGGAAADDAAPAGQGTVAAGLRRDEWRRVAASSNPSLKRSASGRRQDTHSARTVERHYGNAVYFN